MVPAKNQVKCVQNHYRILQINETSQLTGGAQKHFHRLSELLAEAGHDVRRFFPGEISRHEGKTVIGNKLDLLLREFHPDIVHVHTLTHKHLWLLSELSTRGLCVVQTWHDHGAFCLNQSLYSQSGHCERCRGGKYYQAGLQGCVHFPLALKTWWQRTVRGQDPYRDVRKIIVPSHYLMEKALAWGQRRNFFHIYHFMDCLPDEARTVPRRGNVVAYAGRLSKLKGIDTLLAAIQDLPYQLLILGDGEHRDEVAALMQKSEPGKIIWPGFVTDVDYWSQLQQASVLVVSSLCPETFGLVIGDAFSLGIPVIGTNLGASMELIGPNNERGLSVPAGDVAALREALAMVLQNPEVAKNKGMAGRRFVDEHLGWGQYYPALIQCYSEAIALRGEN